MIVSLGEIAETAKKATSGCGHCFGIAEEMAYAMRWLCERGFRGAEKLMHALEQFKAVEFELTTRANELQITGKTGDPVPALALAPSIADLLIAHRDTRKIVIVRALAHPLLLVPFLARAANFGQAVSAHYKTIDANSVVINCNDEGTQVFAPDALTLIQARADHVMCRWDAMRTDIPVLRTRHQLRDHRKATIDSGYTISDAVWKKLQTFAHNTYVPSSKESRLTGAGAGLTDND